MQVVHSATPGYQDVPWDRIGLEGMPVNGDYLDPSCLRSRSVIVMT